jgi:hypothetical protein
VKADKEQQFLERDVSGFAFKGKFMVSLQEAMLSTLFHYQEAGGLFKW